MVTTRRGFLLLKLATPVVCRPAKSGPFLFRVNEICNAEDMTDQALVIDDLAAGYNRSARVLDGVSISIDSGDAFALVGVNGAGKTTLIKSILDFISVDQGSIELFGTSHDRYQARARLAFLPERFQPPYYLTGQGFLRSMADLYRVEYDPSVIATTMRTLDLPHDALAKPVREYSKGMAQKLGLITCLHSQRDLLIMDEPMSGLDPKARYAFKTLLQELYQNGRTLFFSTHVLADIGAVCNKMAILHSGRICFLGSPDECCRQFGSDDLETAYMQCINESVV